MAEIPVPKETLEADTDQVLAHYREARAGLVADPSMQVRLAMARRIAEVLAAEFGCQGACRLLAAAAASLDAAWLTLAEEAGEELDADAILTIAGIAAVELDDLEARRG